jgi:hypothetical protein
MRIDKLAFIHMYGVDWEKEYRKHVLSKIFMGKPINLKIADGLSVQHDHMIDGLKYTTSREKK